MSYTRWIDCYLYSYPTTVKNEPALSLNFSLEKCVNLNIEEVIILRNVCNSFISENKKGVKI